MNEEESLEKYVNWAYSVDKNIANKIIKWHISEIDKKLEGLEGLFNCSVEVREKVSSEAIQFVCDAIRRYFHEDKPNETK